MALSDTQLPNTGLLTLGLYPSSGGPAKSISAFQQALGASVISWVDPKHPTDERVIWKDCTTVRGRREPVFNQLLVPSRADLRAAEEMVAQADILSIHSFWRWHIVWAMNVCKKHNKPYWFVPHGSLDPYVFEDGEHVKRMFLATVGRKFVRNAAAIIFSTEREREKAAEFVPTDHGRIVHWPLHDIDFRDREMASRALVRARHGIPEDAFCFLYLGRLSPMKRPIETIKAFAAANAPNSHLIMVGNEFGVTVQDCRNMAAELSMTDRVHIVGPVYGDEKLTYLDASDAYVSLSNRENFNFTAAEALASDLPLVLSPGNDLAVELQHLDGVHPLQTNTLGEASSAMLDFASRGDFRSGIRRSFARAHFSNATFSDQLNAHASQISAEWTQRS